MRRLICSIYSLMVVTTVVARTESEKPVLGKKPNIVFFFVDDMGWQNTSEPFWTQRTGLNDTYHTPNRAIWGRSFISHG